MKGWVGTLILVAIVIVGVIVANWISKKWFTTP